MKRAQVGHVALCQARQIAEHIQISENDPVHMRPLHLDDRLLAGVQRGAMDLRNRGRSKRHRVDLGEQLGQRLLQLAFNNCSNDRKLFVRGTVLEFGKFMQILRREDIGTCTQELAEFNERWPQFLA